MPAPSGSYKFICWNPWTDFNAASGSGAAGSGWQASNANSFLIIWRSRTMEAETGGQIDHDFSGFSRVAGASCQNGLTLAANNTVHLEWTVPTRRAYGYAIYYQALSAWDFTQDATLVAATDGDTFECDITSPGQYAADFPAVPSNIITLTALGTQPTVLTLSNCYDMQPTERKLVDRAASGDVVPLSYAHRARELVSVTGATAAPVFTVAGRSTKPPMNDMVRWSFKAIGGAYSVWKTLFKWKRYGVPCIALSQNTGFNSNFIIEQYLGVLTGFNWLGENMKHDSPDGTVHITMTVEGEAPGDGTVTIAA